MRRGCSFKAAITAAVVTLFGARAATVAQQLRVLGIDVSAHQGEISVANWATLKRATDQQVGGSYGDGRDFVMIRSSRGGTTGEDHRQGGYPSGNNTFYNLSQRYDDPYYVQNINRATSAGLLAGTYHFSRPDIIATTMNSDGVTTAGVANSGADEADHMIQMAGPWMRPGFLLPVLDFEAGEGIRTDNEMAQFCLDFSDRIYAVMGIRPAIYINGNYAANILATATPPLPTQIVSAFPTLWSARWPNQADPNSIDVQNSNPKDSYTPIYGPWDDPPNPDQPWVLWQYASTARLNGYATGTANIDVDVAQGGVEFVKDLYVPALWTSNSDGQWTTLSNWNNGQTPVAPVQGAGQLARVGPLTLPTPSLPGSNDNVILDRPSAAITVTLASGIHNIRKLYMRETLNMTGGSLTINYLPSWDSTAIAAQFSGSVTLNGGASLSVHTLQVDATRTFTLNGGTLTFNTINLMPDTTTSAKIFMAGDVSFNPLAGSTATISNGSGSGSSGLIDLGGGPRVFYVTNSAELFVAVPISNGALVKSGLGTMRLGSSSSYSGTTVSNGTLLVNNTGGSGTGFGGVVVNSGRLGGTGVIAGAVTVNSGGTISPGSGAAIGTLTLNSVPGFNGTNFMRIDRNGGSPLTDKLVLTSGTLTYDATLVVSNVGAALIGGEVFTNFVAPTYAGAFTATKLPTLSSGLNWYLGDLLSNGRIKVNRSPVAGPALTVTNTPAAQLQIPIAGVSAGATDADGDAITLAGISMVTTNGVTLLTNSTFIFYSNSVNVADQINYTIADGHGGSATGVVNILPSTPGQFIGQPSVRSNSVTLRFAGGPAATYFVERSTNLPVWLTISTNMMPADGVFNYTDDFHDLGAPPSWAFYRLRWSP